MRVLQPYGALFFCPLITAGAGMATTYEAESPANTMTGATKISFCAPCSGRADVGSIGDSNGPNSTLQFNGVAVTTTGQYPVTFYYSNGSSQTLSAYITVNGVAAGTLSFPSSGGWANIASVTLRLSLNQGGVNTIQISNPSGFVADIDRIDVGSASAPLPRPPTNNPPVVSGGSSSNTVSLLSFGSAGTGGDDTAVFQKALSSTAAAGQTLEVPVAARPYNIQPIYLPSNTNLLVDAGVTVQATVGYSTYQSMINIDNVSNVTITATGSTFQMNKPEYTSGEYRHCMSILGTSNVTIQGMTCNNSGGDGMYIAGGTNQSYSYNVTVQNSTFNNNRRNALTIISGQSIYFRRCYFTNTSGTLPLNGIDMEPNTASDRLVDIHIEDSFSTGNGGDGVGFGIGNLTSASQPVSITVLRHTSANNGRAGYIGDYESNGNIAGVSGMILVSQSSSTMDGTYGAWAHFYTATGPSLTFQNLTVTNANQSGATSDNAAVAVERGGGGIGKQGNVYFLNPTITDTTGKIQYYYSVEDFSGVGETRIQFVNPVQLSGAQKATSAVWGRVDGVYDGPLVIQ